MKHSYKLILLTFFLFTAFCRAQQRPVFFGGFDYNRDIGYEANFYGNLNLGFQLYQWKFIAPEVGFNYYFGNVNDSKQLNPVNPQARAPRISDGRFGAAVFSLAPKLIFGNSEAALVVIPQYHFGSIRSRGDFLIDNGDRYLLEEQIKENNTLSFWSIAAGVQGDFFDLEYVSFSLFLKYNFLNSKEALKAIKVPTGYPTINKGSKEGLGIGLRVYFDFLGLLNKK